MIYIFFAHGFEEIEAVTTLDILRRAELPVKSVGVGGKMITGSHGISVECDLLENETSLSDMIAVILPGGMPGTLNLEKSQAVRDALNCATERGLLIAAICAAPSVLGHMGLLEGKRFTCYPGFEEGLAGARHSPERVVKDDKIITAKGPGCAIPFALEIVRSLLGDERAATLEATLQ